MGDDIFIFEYFFEFEMVGMVLTIYLVRILIGQCMNDGSLETGGGYFILARNLIYFAGLHLTQHFIR